MGIASLNAILRKAVLPGTVGADAVRDSADNAVAVAMGIASLNPSYGTTLSAA